MEELSTESTREGGGAPADHGALMLLLVLLLLLSLLHYPHCCSLSLPGLGWQVSHVCVMPMDGVALGATVHCLPDTQGACDLQSSPHYSLAEGSY